MKAFRDTYDGVVVILVMYNELEFRISVVIPIELYARYLLEPDLL